MMFNRISLVIVRNYSNRQLPILSLFTKRKEHCSLCDIAKEQIKPLQAKFIYQEVYIDDPNNISLYKQYRYDIPVIHVNGKFAMKHRVDIEKLKQLLEETSNETI